MEGVSRKRMRSLRRVSRRFSPVSSKPPQLSPGVGLRRKVLYVQFELPSPQRDRHLRIEVSGLARLLSWRLPGLRRAYQRLSKLLRQPSELHPDARSMWERRSAV